MTFLTIEGLKRPYEAQRSHFGLFLRFWGLGMLRWTAIGCDRSAPQLLHHMLSDMKTI